MTTCHRAHIEARCRERGYTLDEVMPCVVAQEGDQWTIDTDHPAYPRIARAGLVLPAPGSELKKLLAGWPFRITATEGCSCNAMASRMDSMGCDWCESDEGMSEILAAMKDNAQKKGVPYIEAAAAMLVRRAVRNARRNAIK